MALRLDVQGPSTHVHWNGLELVQLSQYLEVWASLKLIFQKGIQSLTDRTNTEIAVTRALSGRSNRSLT